MSIARVTDNTKEMERDHRAALKVRFAIDADQRSIVNIGGATD